MKKIIFVFLFVYNLSSSQNNVLPFQNGEKCTYRINYGIINAGYGELSVFNNKDSYQFIGEGRSNLFFDWIFYVRDRYESLVNKKTPSGDIITSSEDFAKYLLDSGGVAVVHGAAFGMDPYFRISYATATRLLVEACKRIQRACETLKH